MIPDVDETLRGLVRREALNGSGVDVAFDAPTREWVARRSGPTVSLYLYDIREDLARREVQWEPVRGDDGIVSDRRPPARRFKLSYMVTAWTQRPEDEHRLLSNLLSCFIRHERLAPEQLSGALAGQPLPLFMTTALPLGTDRSIADVWSALGGELKPSLDLVVTTPFVDARSEKAGPPVREEPKFAFVQPSRNGHGGARTNGHATPALVGAAVGARAAAASAQEDASGGDNGKGRGDGHGDGHGDGGASMAGTVTEGTAASAAGADEAVHRGTDTLPGRIVRVRPMRRSG